MNCSDDCIHYEVCKRAHYHFKEDKFIHDLKNVEDICDYGIFKNGELKLVVNLQANALLIKYVIEQDLQHKIVIKDLLVSATKSKRKLKAITNAEFCDSQPVCFKCPEYAAVGRICNLDYQHDNRPYKTRKGKYILREVKK